MQKRFSEQRIIEILKAGEAFTTDRQVCRRRGIGGNTFYRWKSKSDGLEVSDAERLRELEAGRSSSARGRCWTTRP